MDRKKLAIGAAATVLDLGGGGAAIASQQEEQQAPIAGGDGSSEQQATGPNVEQAKKAALDYTHEGRVTGAEVGDEESYYEIEVTRDDGSQVDVQLDRDFNVVEEMADHEGPDDEDGPEAQKVIDTVEWQNK